MRMDMWDRLLAREGGYVNDPDDPGGETKFGISKRAYPQENIASLTRERAKAIYQEDYWREPGINLLPPPLDEQVMDIAVNCGPTRAIIMLQAILDVKTDGKLGPKTLAALKGKDLEQINDELVNYRKAYYSLLVKKKPSLSKFLKGWNRRAEEFRFEEK